MIGWEVRATWTDFDSFGKKKCTHGLEWASSHVPSGNLAMANDTC